MTTLLFFFLFFGDLFGSGNLSSIYKNCNGGEGDFNLEQVLLSEKTFFIAPIWLLILLVCLGLLFLIDTLPCANEVILNYQPYIFNKEARYRLVWINTWKIHIVYDEKYFNAHLKHHWGDW